MDRSGQHWVPSSYLQAWCDPNCPPGYTPYVWQFPKQGGKSRRKAPENIFKETDIYTIDADGKRDLWLEETLGKFENRFCRIRDGCIRRRELLSTEDRVWLCGFMAAMHFRTRAQRDAFRQQWGHALRMARDLEQTLNNMSLEEIQRHRSSTSLVESTGPSLSIDDVKGLAEKPLQQMLWPMIKQDMAVLMRMELTIFTTDDDVGFTTSDHLCVWFDPERRRGQMTMLESPTVEVIMPICPNSLALLSWEKLPPYAPMRMVQVDEVTQVYQRRGQSHRYETQWTSRCQAP